MATELARRPQRQAPESGKQRQSREMALQMLFQWDQAKTEPGQIFKRFDLYLYGAETSSRPLSHGSNRAFKHARALVEGTLSELPAIDRQIADQAENWRVERMPIVDRNILRLAIYQFLNEQGVPPVVVIDESIELAKKFGSEHSGAFVNGVLDALRERFAGDRKKLQSSGPAGGTPA